MPIVIDCPACNRKLRVGDDLQGRTVKCPTCGQVFTATSVAPPPQPEPGVEAPALGPPPEAPARYAPDQKPGKVQAIAIMTLVGGILAVVNMVMVGLLSGGICCLWPGLYYGLVMGIMAIVKGSQLLGKEGHLQAPPKGIAIMQIINIINGDIPNCVMGILTLVFLGEDEVRNYYQGK